MSQAFIANLKKQNGQKNRFRIGNTEKIEPLSWFAPFSDSAAKKLKNYGAFWGITEIFDVSISGIVSGNKDLILFEKSGHPSCRKIAYRAFDYRYVNYDPKILQRARFDVMCNMFEQNLGLLFQKYDNGIGFITKYIADKNTIDGGNYLAPLYLYAREKVTKDLLDEFEKFDFESKKMNFTSEFVAFFEKQYTCKLVPTESEKFYKQSVEITPEMVLGYVYAVLNREKYREEWNELLDVDSPRIPFVDDKEEFLKLAKIGFDLVKIHLMEAKTLYEIQKKWRDYGKLEGKNFKVHEPKYDATQQKFMINKDAWLANVPKSVIELKICGVSSVEGILAKYLKARRNRILDSDEQQHIQDIVKILLESIEKKGEIDDFKGISIQGHF